MLELNERRAPRGAAGPGHEGAAGGDRGVEGPGRGASGAKVGTHLTVKPNGAHHRIALSPQTSHR